MAAVTKTKRDWAKYNEALVNRGYLTIFVSKDFAREWYVKYDASTPRKRGGQPKYTDKAITASQPSSHVLIMHTSSRCSLFLLHIMTVNPGYGRVVAFNLHKLG